MLLSPAGDDGRRGEEREEEDGRRGLYLEMEGWQECGRGRRQAASE